MTPLEHVDMLMVDRLRAWARNIREYGPDLTIWASTEFVMREMESIADGLERVIRDAPASAPFEDDE